MMDVSHGYEAIEGLSCGTADLSHASFSLQRARLSSQVFAVFVSIIPIGCHSEFELNNWFASPLDQQNVDGGFGGFV